MLQNMIEEERPGLHHWNDVRFWWGFTVVDMENSPITQNERKVTIVWALNKLRVREYCKTSNAMRGSEVPIPREWILAFKSLRWPSFNEDIHSSPNNLWIYNEPNYVLGSQDKVEPNVDDSPIIKILEKMKELDPLGWREKARNYLRTIM